MSQHHERWFDPAYRRIHLAIARWRFPKPERGVSRNPGGGSNGWTGPLRCQPLNDLLEGGLELQRGVPVSDNMSDGRGEFRM